MRGAVAEVVRAQLFALRRYAVAVFAVLFAVATFMGVANGIAVTSQVRVTAGELEASRGADLSGPCNFYAEGFTFDACQAHLNTLESAQLDGTWGDPILDPVRGAARTKDTFSSPRALVSGARLAATVLGMLALLVLLAPVVVGAVKRRPQPLMKVYVGSRSLFLGNTVVALVCAVGVWLTCTLGWLVGGNAWLLTSTPVHVAHSESFLLPLATGVAAVAAVAVGISSALHFFSDAGKAFYVVPGAIIVVAVSGIIPVVRYLSPGFYLADSLGLEPREDVTPTTDYMWAPNYFGVGSGISLLVLLLVVAGLSVGAYLATQRKVG